MSTKKIYYRSYFVIYNQIIKSKKSNLLILFAFFYALLEIITLGLTALFIRIISDSNYINEIKKYSVTKFIFSTNISIVTSANFYILFILVLISKYIFSLIYFNNIYNTIFNFSTTLNSILAKAIFNQKFYKLKSEKYQSTKNIFFKEIDYYITYFLQPFLLLLPDIFQMIFLLILVLIILPKVSIIIIIVLISIVYIINKLIKYKILNLSKRLTQHQRNRTLVLGNLYSNILFWRVKNLYNTLENYFLIENKIISKSNSELNYYQQVPRLTYEFLIYFIFSAVALLNTNNSTQVFTSFVVMSLATIKLLPSAVKFSSFLQSALSAKYIITTLNEIIIPENIVKKEDVEYTFTDFANKIELQNAVFKYDNNVIINNCSFLFEKNDIISISGNSGTGKSTLIEILLGQHQLNFGKYFYDGIDITNKCVNFSNIVGIVPQTIQFINDTLRANLIFGINEIVSDEEIMEKLESCNLIALFEKLPLGLDTIIDNNMNQFSGGERQRIAITRCLLDKHVKILVFDEITSALDEENSIILLNSIMKYKKKYSMIFITHNTLIRKFCTKNYEFSNGTLNIINTNFNN